MWRLLAITRLLKSACSFATSRNAQIHFANQLNYNVFSQRRFQLHQEDNGPHHQQRHQARNCQESPPKVNKKGHNKKMANRI